MPTQNIDNIIKIKAVYDDGSLCNGIRLLSLTIDKRTNSSYCKILKPGKFVFVTQNNEVKEQYGTAKKYVDANLYGKNISIQAIVGENGSGKTSLLDIIYRIINNFSYYLMHELKYTDAARPLAFVKDVYAKVEYEMDSMPYSIECKGDELALITPEKKYRVGSNSEKDWVEFEDVSGAKTEKVREVMKNFFYTIVTNFSFNAFLSSDYAMDYAVGLHGKSWIDSLFNKNDGYRTPIVLNPYRGNGLLDVQKETDFAVSRTIAILYYYKSRNRQFIDGYKLNCVKYHYDPHSFLGQFRGILTREERDMLRKIGENGYVDEERTQYERIIRDKFTYALSHPTSYANLILQEFDIKPQLDNEVHFMACCYLIYKVFSIIQNYPAYSAYEEYGDIANCFEIIGSNSHHPIEESTDLFPAIIKSISEDKSHITYKLRLTLQFLRQRTSKQFARKYCNDTFDFDQYKEYIGKESISGNLERILELFPMPLFKPEILLDKIGDNGEIVNKGPIPFVFLSSGEKLFTYTLSSIIYHIINIKSVSSSRIHYRRMNIVMDELELCFHPEMQRRFIGKLATTIRQLRLNTHCKFNFLLVTHSPFILSDIPSDRILYLQEGKDVGNEMEINPFGTNINEVLFSNFFLNQSGFLGKIAQEQISSLVKYLNNRNVKFSSWDDKRAEYFINNIVGDPFIKEQLLEMLKK